MADKKKMEDNQPGMDQKRDVPNDDYQETHRASNYGQGSSYLAGDSYHQGDEKSKGSNYDTEKGKLSEARDDIPHGQGAHVNEKESNAQEDYPGTQEADTEEPERDII